MFARVRRVHTHWWTGAKACLDVQDESIIHHHQTCFSLFLDDRRATYRARIDFFEYEISFRWNIKHGRKTPKFTFFLTQTQLNSTLFRAIFFSFNFTFFSNERSNPGLCLFEADLQRREEVNREKSSEKTYEYKI